MNWFVYVSIAAFCTSSTTAYTSTVRQEVNNPPKDCSTNPGEVLESSSTVEDLERCAPYLLEDRARLYYQSGAGRGWTLRENQIAFERLQILQRILRDVSKVDLSVTVLNQRISMPIAIAPAAYQKLASELGEVDTIRAASRYRTLMVLSTLSTTTIEDVANAAPNAVRWMQLYVYADRRLTLSIIQRAEAAGFSAIVVTVDAPIFGPLPINAVDVLEGNSRNLSAVNTKPYGANVDPSLTFENLKWVIRRTKLPVVAKGILTADDALRAAGCGVSAIWVSNHGGRQLDYSPATIDVLPKIVKAVKHRYPFMEVYMDGGIRNGYSVFKALALGAQAVFIGRPVIWGLAAGDQRGVEKVLNILRTEINDTMIIAGTPNVRSISKEMITSERKCCYLDD